MLEVENFQEKATVPVQGRCYRFEKREAFAEEPAWYRSATPVWTASIRAFHMAKGAESPKLELPPSPLETTDLVGNVQVALQVLACLSPRPAHSWRWAAQTGAAWQESGQMCPASALSLARGFLLSSQLVISRGLLIRSHISTVSAISAYCVFNTLL